MATVQLNNGLTAYYRDRDVAIKAGGGVEVIVSNLSVSSEAPARDHVPTMLSNKYIGCCRTKKTDTTRILTDTNLVFQEGQLTLLLGPPGCGKTLLLNAIAGRLDHGGDILFNGVPVEEVDMLRTVSMFDATDVHIPHLTVRETLDFADKCLNGVKDRNEFRDHNVEVVLRLLGLSECADTKVGDEKVRGVSGGQRRRVTAAEALVSGSKILLCDELSTGLDSEATLDIVRALKSWAVATNGTAIIALLQPPPEVVAVFDQLVCLDKGHVFYAGNPMDTSDYLQRMGFEMPPRSDLADFLQEITGPRGADFWNPQLCGVMLDAPPTLEDWIRTLDAKQMIENRLEKYDFKTHVQALSHVKRTDRSKLKNNGIASFKMLLKRQWDLARRDKVTLASLFGEAVFVGLLMGAVFWNSARVELYMTPRSGMGALFFSCAILQRQAWQQIPLILQHRPIYYKQNKRNFFSTISFVAAFTSAQIPFNVLSMCLFSPIVYFMTNFDRSADTFFFFLLTMILLQHALRALFMCIGAASSSASSAQFSSSIFVVSFLLFSGYILTFNLIPPYWIWIYWINPLAYAMRSLTLNEYTSSKYTPEQSESVINAYEYGDQTGIGYLWAGPILFVFYFLLFHILAIVALQFIRYDAVKPKVIPPSSDEIDEKKASIDIESGQSRKHTDFEPVTISFRDINYTVFPRNMKAGKQLLHQVSGIFRPGRLTALMGSSGAGKTTLMDVISFRKKGKVEGDIFVNGVPCTSSSDFSKISGYIEQMNIHTPTATIEEAFMFSACLRQPQEVSIEEKETFVKDTIELLELEVWKDFQIGSTPADGLSGEQRKRVTIGVELAANPAVIFADEPTSGLDARAARIIMNVFKKIAKQNRAIVCTIHQPNSMIFEAFDDLLLLQKGGHTIFNGALGSHSCNLIEYFEFNGARKILDAENPANYMLNIIGAGIDNNAKPEEKQMSIFEEESVPDPTVDFRAVYQNSSLKADIIRSVEVEVSQGNPEKVASILSFPNNRFRAASLSHQLQYCCKKSFTTYWRSPHYNFKRMICLVLLAILFGTAYLRGGAVFPIVNSSQVRSFGALIYLCMDFLSMVNMFTVLPITFRERSVYYRERAAQMYSPVIYGFALFLTELPYVVVSTAIYSIILYLLVGMNSYWLGFFYLIFLLYIGLATYIGQLSAFACPNEVVGQIVVGALTVFFNLFSGYLVAPDALSPVIGWLYYIVPSSYAFNAIASTQLGYCPTPRDPKFYGCSVIASSNQTLATYSVDLFDLRTHWVYSVDIPVLLAFWLLCLGLLAYSLLYISHDTR